MLNGFKYSKTQFDSKFEIDFRFNGLVLALEMLGWIQGALVLVWKKKKNSIENEGIVCLVDSGQQWSSVVYEAHELQGHKL